MGRWWAGLHRLPIQPSPLPIPPLPRPSHLGLFSAIATTCCELGDATGGMAQAAQDALSRAAQASPVSVVIEPTTSTTTTSGGTRGKAGQPASASSSVGGEGSPGQSVEYGALAIQLMMTSSAYALVGHHDQQLFDLIANQVRRSGCVCRRGKGGRREGGRNEASRGQGGKDEWSRPGPLVMPCSLTINIGARCALDHRDTCQDLSLATQSHTLSFPPPKSLMVTCTPTTSSVFIHCSPSPVPLPLAPPLPPFLLPSFPPRRPVPLQTVRYMDSISDMPTLINILCAFMDVYHRDRWGTRGVAHRAE